MPHIERPKGADSPALRSHQIKNQSSDWFFIWWERMDSNHRSRKTTDLQVRLRSLIVSSSFVYVWFSTTAGNWEHVVMRTTGSISTARDSFGRYRPCIVLDTSVPISTGNAIDCIITPTLNSISVSSTWAVSNTATLTATSATHYAVTTTNTPPSSGWQTSNVFTLTGNGTYYAWARSVTDTVSASKSFTVSRVDRTKPAVNSVTVPVAWATTSTVAI